MKIKIVLLAMLLFAAVGAKAQTVDQAWNVTVNGNFTSLANSPTNNGVLISTALKLATHWDLRADTYLLNSPNITIILGGPEYRFSLAKLFKNSTGAINAQNVTAFVNTGLGDAHSTAVLSSTNSTQTTTTISKFAYAVGGGFDIAISPTVSLRPLDVKYIRTSMIVGGGQLIGNHLDFSAGLGLHF